MLHLVHGINYPLDEIKNVSASSVTPTPSPEPTPKQSGNDTIKAIQQWLNDNYNTGIAVDGLYGSQTKKALVKALQTELNKQFNRNLKVDGIFRH